MYKNRMIGIVVPVGLLLAAVFALGAGFGRSTQAFAPVGAQISTVQQPSRDIPLASAEASDYIQRHPEMLRAGDDSDKSDYFQRHPTSNSAIATGASDWFERHPEALKAANAVDQSDYYQRHPNKGVVLGPFDQHQSPFSTLDTSDWFLRHPNEFNAK